MIKSLLIANRGEIACRIIRTARAMGIRTIAVYSDADSKALHVRQADEAIHIGLSPANESYLVGAKIIAAAKESGAEAIHPGYGFLSENADFAQSVIDAGLIWVGPKPHSIRAMGLKDAAKILMQEAGVPVTPGYIGDNQEPQYLAKQADEIGYPVLIKAIAGGGGKGMRKVDNPADFADSLTSCQREAKASFGNDIVLIEKWIESPRHIEVQIFGDSHGNVVHLFERDCSLQRRHQKVIEEAPAPGMDEATREAVCGAAVRAAQAVDYEGAGTVEFIADGSDGLKADKIWFMEMNTRLQVEHPVTEEITSVDLVEWQLRVASGEEIPLRQDELSINGHAIEARLYAEDPANGFLPSTGMLDEFWIAKSNRRDGENRIDTGVEKSSEISPYYDPMIAKLIVKRNNRASAAKALAQKLGHSYCWPVKWNSKFLRNLVQHAEFLLGNIDTGFIEKYKEDVIPSNEPTSELLQAAATLFAARASGIAVIDNLDDTVEDWIEQSSSGFRLNSERKKPLVKLDHEGVTYTVELEGTSIWDLPNAKFVDGGIFAHDHAGRSGFFIEYKANKEAAGTASDGAILSPMPGKIIAVDISEGDSVTKGQKLLTLEAMKMEHSLTAPFDGIVSSLNAALDAQVQVDALLAQIDAEA